MDVNWFKQQQKTKGVTSEALGEALGRDRTIVSRIYHGRQSMTPDQAEVFARLLNVPIEEVAERAGLKLPRLGRAAPTGLSESDVTPWRPKGDDPQPQPPNAESNSGAGRDIWRINTRAMILAGYAEGDWIVVDQHILPEAGDVVVAQVYDWEIGSAATVLRRYDPPVLVAASTDPSEWRVHVVDNKNVKIMGVVISSWRSRR